jgi:hypothetical protein
MVIVVATAADDIETGGPGSGPGRKVLRGDEHQVMPELAGILLRKSVGALDSGRARCFKCRRTPLIGERLHETDNGRRFCDLCVEHVPERDRGGVRIERVHASDTHLSVAPRAA